MCETSLVNTSLFGASSYYKICIVVTCMYVCRHVFMYVYIYECIYVCMGVRVYFLGKTNGTNIIGIIAVIRI